MKKANRGRGRQKVLIYISLIFAHFVITVSITCIDLEMSLNGSNSSYTNMSVSPKSIGL